ncbi:MAG TPA: ABC transporter permease [Dehalococcoidia bacterium]|jgi:peptide/nickel transport system permease protein|nr:ABC transporter permease [Dehalococcoidia bacterium]
MGQYIIRRLLLAIPVLVAVSILVFGGTRVVPGDICLIVVGSVESVTEEQCNRIEADLGLDKPVVEQYFTWVGNALQGDLGRSMVQRRPVLEVMSDRIPTTVELALLASILAIVIALPIGVFSALKQDKLPDVLARVVTIGWLSMPSFWVGTMLVTLPAIWWGYATPVPYVQFWEDPLKNLEQMYLPTISLALALSATIARLTRSSMLEVLRQDYVRTARAKGLQERVVLSKHALKNAMLPVITLIGIQLGFLLSGTVVLEFLFALPGLGTLLIESVITKDFAQVQGLVLFFSVIIVVINIAVDLSYALFDPRVRFS